MSGDSSDEVFASADEGSDSEMPSTIKLLDSKSAKDSSISKPESNNIWNSSEDKSSSSKLSSENVPPTNRKKTSTEKPLPVVKEGESSVIMAKPVVKLEDVLENQIVDNKLVPLIEGDSWDVEDDPWLNPQESNKTTASTPPANSRKVITGNNPEQKKNLPSEDAWDAEDGSLGEVVSRQTENAPEVLAIQLLSSNFEDLREFDPLEKVNEVSKFTDKSSARSPQKIKPSKILENPPNSEDADAWNVEDDPWGEFADEPSGEVAKESDPSGNIQLPEVEDSFTEVVKDSDRKSKSQSKSVKEDLSKSIPAKEVLLSRSFKEEESAWDLEDDPWAESQSKEAEESNACDLENDHWINTEPKKVSSTEADWENMEDLHAKLSSLAGPSSITSQELTSTASALVKSVGGGLASFMAGLRMPNLSGFEEPQAPKPPPEGETNEQAAAIGGGWSAWDLGSIAKTLTSTVENTGIQLITGGVDILEQIGRKTFTALKENDPGLVYTKRFLRPMLREARDHQHTPEPGSVEARRGDLAFQLESRLALVHMEALELLSSRASARLITKLTRLESTSQDDVDISSLTSEGGVLERIRQTLQVKKADSEAPEQDTGSEYPVASLSDAVKVLDQIVPGNALIKTCDEVQNKSRELEPDLPMKEIFYRSIEALAERTSAVLGYLHKLAECLLLIGQQHHYLDQFKGGFLDVAEKVASMITAAKRQNEAVASNNRKEGIESEDPLIASRRLVASLFLETGMANSYLDDAATNHLVPVLQVACLDAFFHEPSPTREIERPTKSKLR
ncbi:unnamed protein product [Hymenolepis diminuta]|uniref:Protein FAM114A2 n=1 Tax=Hymenolepis diminuta TaxID=6216 RepID=A0A158QDX7_HYMDI|nr:unnamed protein product [Hymenolepis diminuta]